MEKKKLELRLTVARVHVTLELRFVRESIKTKVEMSPSTSFFHPPSSQFSLLALHCDIPTQVWFRCGTLHPGK